MQIERHQFTIDDLHRMVELGILWKMAAWS